MTPFDLTHVLSRANERLNTAWTAAAALITLTVVAAIARLVFEAFSFRMAEALVATSALGAVVALILVYISWTARSDVYDAIVLTRFRHVGGDEVKKHAAALVSRKRRRQYAAGIERFLETTSAGLPSPLPINRQVVRQFAPRLEAIATALRSDDQTVTPEGMVLVRRLICDGATSPLYAAATGKRDAERALDRIDDTLVLHTQEHSLALAA